MEEFLPSNEFRIAVEVVENYSLPLGSSLGGSQELSDCLCFK